MKLDKQALLEWLEICEVDSKSQASEYDIGMGVAFSKIRKEIQSGRFDVPDQQANYTEQDIQTALTRELTDERVATAVAYWLDASPHERWVPDGIILARYARYAMAEIDRLRAALEDIRDHAIRFGTATIHLKAEQSLSTTTEPTAEDQDKTCVMCGIREGINLSTANRRYCEPCTDALPSAFEPTGAERAKAEIADRYKNSLHGWHNPVDRAAGSYYNGYLNGVRETLRILGITIPGINTPEKEGRTE